MKAWGPVAAIAAKMVTFFAATDTQVRVLLAAWYSGVDQAVHRGFPAAPLSAREIFASQTSKPPTQLPTHFSFTGGRHSGSARVWRASPAQTRRIPGSSRAGQWFRHWYCELDRKSKIPAYAAVEDRRHWRMHAKQIAPRTFFVLRRPPKGTSLC